MTHNEPITVYELVNTEDGYAGASEKLEAATGAPTVATITNNSGNDTPFLAANRTISDYTVTVNDNGFVWSNKNVIETRFGFMKVIAIRETERKRRYELSANIVRGEVWEQA